jgi:orotate phosphoribosyltransferase
MLDRQTAAGLLLSAHAVMLNLESPFRYTSGILSPIYCDNRVLISDPERRRQIVAGLVEAVRSLAPTANVVAGTATAGIPWAAWVAERLDFPMVYVRATAKEHGRGQRVEGRLPAPAVAVVIEDLVTTGGSSLGTVEALRDAGAEVAGVAAIFSYGLRKADDALAAAGVPLRTLTGLHDLLRVAEQSGYVPASQRETLVAAIRTALGDLSEA